MEYKVQTFHGKIIISFSNQKSGERRKWKKIQNEDWIDNEWK